MATVHPTAVIEPGAELDDDVRIGPYAIVWADVHIGARTVVGSHRVLDGRVGLGSDCQSEEGVIMANQDTLGGHIEVGRHAIISGLTASHQIVRIGEYAFVGGCSGVNQDIPPYLKVQGVPAKPLGLNAVGLRRHGFSTETIHALKEAYRIVFLSDLNTSQALERMEKEFPSSPEVQRFIGFIKRSQRGISK